MDKTPFKWVYTQLSQCIDNQQLTKEKFSCFSHPFFTQKSPKKVRIIPYIYPVPQ